MNQLIVFQRLGDFRGSESQGKMECLHPSCRGSSKLVTHGRGLAGEGAVGSASSKVPGLASETRHHCPKEGH